MTSRIFLVLALGLLGSCGGSSDPKALADEGSKALNSGDYATAVARFDDAVEATGNDSAHPEWLRSKLGAIQGLAQTDPGKSKDDFLQLAAANPSKVTADHFYLVGSRLGHAKHLPEATAVLEAGLKAHTESPQLLALRKELGDAAKAGDDPEALKALESLGYSGK